MKNRFLLCLLAMLLLASFGVEAQQSYPWFRQIGGSLTENIYRNTVDSRGNVIVVGAYGDSAKLADATFQRSRGKQDAFVTKYDKSGNPLWTRTAGGKENDAARGVATDAAGNVYVTGEITTSNAVIGATNTDTIFFGATTVFSAGATRYSQSGFNFFLAKYSPTGDLLFVKTGDSKFDCQTYTLAVDTEGGVYVAGTFRDTMKIGNFQVVQPWLLNGAGTQFSIRGPDNFLAKYDANGNPLWLKQTKTTWANRGVDAHVKVGGDGKIYWTGEYLDSVRIDTFNITNGVSGFGDEIFALRLNKNGAVERLRRISSTGDDWAGGIVSDGSGGAIVAGSFVGTLTVGNQSATAVGARDAFIVRLDADFNPVWLKTAGGINNERIRDIARLSTGDLVVVGDFTGQASLWDATGKDTLQSAGSADWFVAQYRADGVYQTAKRWGGSGFETCASITATAGDSLVLSGWFGNVSRDTGSIRTQLRPSLSETGVNNSVDGAIMITYFCPKTPIAPTVAGNLIFCAGDSVRLSLPSGFSQYWWSTGDSAQTLTVKSQNNYFGRYNNALGCVLSTVNQPIFVEVKPTPPIPTIAATNDTLRVTPPANYAFQWLRDNTPLSNSNQNFWKMTANGRYTVQLLATNGCTSISQPFVFTRVGTQDLLPNLTATLTPNPTIAGQSAQIFMVAEKSQTLDIQVVNAVGQVIYAEKIPVQIGNNTLDLPMPNTLSRGLHIVQITTAGGHRASVKWLTQ